MRRSEIYIILSALFLLLIVLSYLYVFNIYEVIYKVTPKDLYADNRSEVEITSVPINALGWKTPFRNVPVEFEIREGNNLVEIVYLNNEDGILKLKAKDKTGSVIVFIKSKYALLPSSVTINIYPNLALEVS